MKEKIINSEIKIFNRSFSTKKIFLHPLFAGSFFMIVGSNFANFMAYIYHLILGRVMGPASYGELVATISTIGLMMSLISFFGLVIVKFVSSAKQEETPFVLGWFSRKTIITALIVSVLILILSPLIGSFERLPKYVNLLFAPIVDRKSVV
jgi:O-antigen/teichoic acid export membrane protein